LAIVQPRLASSAVIFLPLPPICWNYRHVLPHPAITNIFNWCDTSQLWADYYIECGFDILSTEVHSSRSGSLSRTFYGFTNAVHHCSVRQQSHSPKSPLPPLPNAGDPCPDIFTVAVV
jgi:hypothetical protein